MISRVFIDRPIFAWVIAIAVMIAGLGALLTLPVSQYPDVAPPQVTIEAFYAGASAQTIQDAVTQIIEQQLTGLDGLLYFSSSSSSQGQCTITATFRKGTDPDIAQVQVQNRAQLALLRLPQEVQQQGLTVRKSNPDALLFIALYDESGARTNQEIADFLVSNLQDNVGRLPGVGDTSIFGSQNAMRIWFNPDRLASFGLMPSDVISAVRSQSTEVAAGEIGGMPQGSSQMLRATVTTKSRLRTVEEFERIILRSQSNGAVVRLSDVARVEIGAENYSSVSRFNRHPGAALGVFLAPGADALETAALVKAATREAAKTFPPALRFTFPVDSTAFIELSIREVVKALIEAIVLVVAVIFIFLRSWRATLVPTIAVPVVLLGTLAVLHAVGFSINTLTLFGLVLAIGLLVDDAIVVVENVERVMAENPGMSAREATLKSMGEITVALVAIAVVLSAVFLPMAFFGGSTGVIYRQFAVTMVSAMVLSALVALILSPALTAQILQRKLQTASGAGVTHNAPMIDRLLAAISLRYEKATQRIIGRSWPAIVLYAGMIALLIVLFAKLPTGFLPTEDQGAAIVAFQLPSDATQVRTQAVQNEIETYLSARESANIKMLFSVSGGGFGPSGQNTGMAYLDLKDWSERKGAVNSAEAIAQRAATNVRSFRDAQAFALTPPAIRGLGQSNGFTMQLLNTGGLSSEEFFGAREQLLKAARADPDLESVRTTELSDTLTLHVSVDEEKRAAMGLAPHNINETLSAAWGGQYVNDFVDNGRIKRVYAQGDAPFRSRPSDLDRWFVRGEGGEMAPFSAFSHTSWTRAPSSLSRFNGVPSFEFQGTAAPGRSSGEAMAQMREHADGIRGTSISWAGLSYQEQLSSGQAPLVYGVALLVVFLSLAALFESWSIPFAVLLIVPLGLIGAVLAVTLRGLTNDIYLQVGLLTTMGLACKNAILMIEYADQAERNGAGILQAALAAAKIRLRPILMTSLAFIFGVLPLAISTGAGANSRLAIGTAVVGGMLSATILALFYIPLFFVIVRRLTFGKRHSYQS